MTDPRERDTVHYHSELLKSIERALEATKEEAGEESEAWPEFVTEGGVRHD
jgi:hypothetical protein